MATRFYFNTSQLPAVSPALTTLGWGQTGAASRARTMPRRQGITMSTIGTVGTATTPETVLLLQFVTEQLLQDSQLPLF